jgi:gas vesicle protein
MNTNVSNKLLYLLAGAAAGILFAPKTGQETRGAISEKIGEMKNRLQQTAGTEGVTETMKGTVRSIVDRGRDVVNISRERINNSIEAGRRRYNDSVRSVEEPEDRDIASM